MLYSYGHISHYIPPNVASLFSFFKQSQVCIEVVVVCFFWGDVRTSVFYYHQEVKIATSVATFVEEIYFILFLDLVVIR